MKYFIICLIGLSLVGCTKEEKKSDPFKSIACGIGKTIGAGIASGIATKLECKKPQAIEDTLVGVLESAKICDKQAQSFSLMSEGATANGFMCESIGNLFLAGLVQGAVPKEWECNPIATKKELELVIAVACAKIQ